MKQATKNVFGNIARQIAARGVFVGFVVLLAFCVAAIPAHAAKSKKRSSGENPKYASLIMDADTGVILHQSSPDKILHPASVAKMMTLLMTFEAIEQGRTSLRNRVVISKHAQGMVPSKLDLGVGASIRVEDAIYALVTKSANDIAAALGEHIGGTESNFAEMMNRKAAEIGMTRTHYRNASGLHDPRQVTSVRDQAKLARYILQRYPNYYPYFSTRSFTYNKHTYRNHNRLMETYKGMDGFKTGFIQPSGFNLVASAKRGNRRLIGVVFGGRTTQSRNAHMASLLDAGFAKVGPGVGIMANGAGVVDDTPIMAFSAYKVAPLPPRKPSRTGDIQIHTAPASAASGATALPPDLSGGPRPGAPVSASAAMNNAAGAATPAAAIVGETARWAELAPMLQNKAISRLIGEGDSDPAAETRLETGYMAIAAARGDLPAPIPPTERMAALSPAAQAAPVSPGRDWAIQIGAFSSRVKTDRALQSALLELPDSLGHGQPVIAPLRTAEGWLFRGRLSGYSQVEAQQACTRLASCLPVGPHAN